MSLSRKLVEKLVGEEIKKNPDTYQDLDVERLAELSSQVFLIQVTQSDPKAIKRSLQDKIEHFNAIMTDS
ncbi:hypothetical protein J6I90_08240 [Pseudidiomarina sp. 1APP75-32.1]|uniref:Uncharacterized protein n=1 Tax=Pseudidiomarina terrestris TaxID=2820060 RepID=A0AAW7R0S9_9GAMM|nr:hypothetical protein [Pseudidiomarina sp. 1APP75-32.1]MDN7124869.1 hypothetical protein [Pseudidiomarina sp. 1APP75-32.1]